MIDTDLMAVIVLFAIVTGCASLGTVCAMLLFPPDDE